MNSKLDCIAQHKAQLLVNAMHICTYAQLRPNRHGNVVTAAVVDVIVACLCQKCHFLCAFSAHIIGRCQPNHIMRNIEIKRNEKKTKTSNQ